ncbi:MAG: ATP synthase F0 subunit C, partial [Tidjanibacter sp.]|nr:ATP synthase F0 subunit C [Tidjanibacter sp.]
LAVLAAAWGIGKIGSNALEAMARQPEAAGSLQTAMIVSAALIEGATLFAIVVCLMAL